MQAELKSNLACASPVIVVSNSITMNVNPILQPTITISGTTVVLAGASSLITSAVVNGGTSPGYQWQDSTSASSWKDIPNANSQALNYSPAATGVKLRCHLISSEACVTSATVASTPLAFIVNTPTGLGNISNNHRLHLYPNPVTGSFVIDSLLLSAHWQELLVINLQAKKVFQINIEGQMEVKVDVNSLPSGVYVALLRNRSGEMAYFKFTRL